MLCAAAACTGGLAGCADYGRLSRLAPGGVDVRSASADTVRAAQARGYAYPDLRNLPPRPTDLRKPSAYAAQAGALRGDRAALERWAATHPAEHDDGEGYAQARRGEVLDPARAAPPADQADRSEAWAERMRAAAKPPKPLS